MTATADKTVVGPFALPYFPPRPAKGPPLASPTQLSRLGFYIQPKLNGDRACLAITGDRLVIQNRHGQLFRQPVELGPWHELLGRGQFLLDGEVWKKGFYPFEAVVLGGEDISRHHADKRAMAAARLCHAVGVDWLFDSPDSAWFTEQTKVRRGDLTRTWEGIVMKRFDSPYVAAGSATAESSHWFKVKFP